MNGFSMNKVTKYSSQWEFSSYAEVSLSQHLIAGLCILWSAHEAWRCANVQVNTNERART